MRHRRKTSYRLDIKDYWWARDRKKWIHHDDLEFLGTNEGYSSSKRFKTAHAAFKAFWAAVNRGLEPELCAHRLKKGKYKTIIYPCPKKKT